MGCLTAGWGRIAAFALIMATAAAAAEIEPKAVEEEIRTRKLAGAAGNLHLMQAPAERFAVWMEGAQAGDPACQWLVGRSLEYGFTVDRNPEEAARWYRRAVEKGYARAQLSLGLLTAAGKGVPADPAEAVRLYRSAADQPNCPEAYEWLIQAHNRGLGIPKDPEQGKALGAKAVAAYQAMADQGYAGAQMRLGRILTSGTWGTPVDTVRGLELYRRGAEQGHVFCQTNLADAYAHGRYGLTRDLARAVEFYRLAIAQGDTISRRNLVTMYLDGEVPNPDPAEADRLYQATAPALRAVEATDADAVYRLAQMAEQGAGRPRDEAEAIALYRRAMEAGSAPAGMALADRLETGRGIPQDAAEAARVRARFPAKPKPAP